MEDGRTAGYAYAGLYRTRVAYRHTLEDSIYIDPASHRRGVGRALLDRLLTESEARGFRQMVAVIGDSAQIPSIALHRAAGFGMVGTFEAVGFKLGRWLDTVLMQRPLGEGAGTMRHSRLGKGAPFAPCPRGLAVRHMLYARGHASLAAPLPTVRPVCCGTASSLSSPPAGPSGRWRAARDRARGHGAR